MNRSTRCATSPTAPRARRARRLPRRSRRSGARVTFVTGPATVPPPAGVQVVRGGDGAADAGGGRRRRCPPMPRSLPPPWPTGAWPMPASSKMKKDGVGHAARADLRREPRHPGDRRARRTPARPRLVVGFAAETDDVVAHATRQAARARAATGSWRTTCAPGTGHHGRDRECRDADHRRRAPRPGRAWPRTRSRGGWPRASRRRWHDARRDPCEGSSAEIRELWPRGGAAHDPDPARSVGALGRHRPRPARLRDARGGGGGHPREPAPRGPRDGLHPRPDAPRHRADRAAGRDSAEGSRCRSGPGRALR